jgi:hypothetical protein
MKHALRYFMLLCVPLLFTSCLDIVENIFIRKDGSGTYKLTLTVNENTRRMMVDNRQEIDEEEEDDFNPVGDAADLKKNFEKLGEDLQKVKGVTKYEAFSNEESMEFGYTFEFEDVEALNKCMEIAAGSSLGQMPGPFGKGKKTVTPNARYIEWNKKSLIRHQSAELAKTMDMKKNGGNNAGMMGGLDVSYIFQDMRYACTYEFEQAFKTFNNEAAIAENGNKSLSLVCYPFAPTPKTEKEAKLNEQACSQAVIIDFK